MIAREPGRGREPVLVERFEELLAVAFDRVDQVEREGEAPGFIGLALVDVDQGHLDFIQLGRDALFEHVAAGGRFLVNVVFVGICGHRFILSAVASHYDTFLLAFRDTNSAPIVALGLLDATSAARRLRGGSILRASQLFTRSVAFTRPPAPQTHGFPVAA